MVYYHFKICRFLHRIADHHEVAFFVIENQFVLLQAFIDFIYFLRNFLLKKLNVVMAHV